jgi:hypothetical protein
MKKSFIILILSASIYFLAGFKATTAQVPLVFKGSLFYSPALTWGLNASWDELGVFLPIVLVHEGTFYMFYTGMNDDGIACIGLATSTNGYDFDKFQGNPVLAPSVSGFDSYHVARGAIIESSSGWVMYYGARELAAFGPGPSIGRATATDLSGPWTKSPDPVLTVGSPDEWDNGFIEPDNVLPLDDGTFIMFYHAGDYPTGMGYQTGMATSPDGLTWTKYDDPTTTDPPYAESDPVLKVGDPGDWDENRVWLCSVMQNDFGYEMYYTGRAYDNIWGFGYATSPDGIEWTKYADNPIYTIDDDPYALEYGYNVIEGPAVVSNGLTAFMYYHYDVPSPGVIGMATAPITGMEDQSAVGSQQSAVVSYPNPTDGISHFTFRISQYQHVTLKIYDVNGREVAVVVNEKLPAGEHTINFDASGLPAGVYFYQLTSFASLRMTGDDCGQTTSGKLVKY